jgi:hypothetical protein
MFVLDGRTRATPLSYVRNTDWPAWVDFIQKHADIYWPLLTTETSDQNVQDQDQQHYSDRCMMHSQPPPRTQQEPNSQPIPDPKPALTLEMATMVSGGKITPVQAEYFCFISHRDSDADDEEEESDMSDSDSDSDSNNDDSSSSSSRIVLGRQEMAEIMEILSVPKAHATPILWGPY